MERERKKGNIEIVGIAYVAEIRRRLPEPSPRAPPRCFGFSFSARAKNKTKAAATVSELNEILIQRSDRCGSALWRFDKEGSGRVEEGLIYRKLICYAVEAERKHLAATFGSRRGRRKIR